jgi:murein L,D-transpeptidase YafK
MRRRCRARALVTGLVAGILVFAALQGCSSQRAAPVEIAAPQPTPPLPDDRAPLEWARDEPYFIVVSRSCRTLTLYRWGQWLQTYDHLAFGANDGDKLYEGDRRTPRGLYMIVGKRHHPRWSRFMLLDYPNTRDLAAWKKAVEQDRVSGGPGGEVGIHGTDKPRFNELGIDWTYGCISMRSEDVRELYDVVPDGTLVLIGD